jgi:hypothetical protein
MVYDTVISVSIGIDFNAITLTRSLLGSSRLYATSVTFSICECVEVRLVGPVITENLGGCEGAGRQFVNRKFALSLTPFPGNDLDKRSSTACSKASIF